MMPSASAACLNSEGFQEDATSTGAGSPSGAAVKKSTSNAGDAGDAGLIPGSGRSLGERNASHSNYSCLEKSHGQRSLAETVHGVRKESEMTEHNTQHISLTSTWTSALCSESAESQPVDRQRTSYGQLLEAMTQSLLSV